MLDAYIVNCFDEIAGSELTADVSAAATSITVADLMDFNQDSDGGSLTIDDGTNNETVIYTVPDGSTGAITVPALAHAYVTGTPVTVSPQIIERWADVVQPDGEEPLRCLVSHTLRALIPLGPRNLDDGTAEHVYCERQGGDLVIVDVFGKDVPGLDLATYPDDVVAVDDIPIAETISWLLNGTRTNSVAAWRGPTRTGLAFASFYPSGGAGRILFDVITEGSPPTVAAFLDIDHDQITFGVVDSAPKTLIGPGGSSSFEFDASGGWQNWTPTLTGWSANPTNTSYRYKQTGKLVTAVIRQGTNGTSNATTKTISLPVTAATITNGGWEAAATATDNGSQLASPARAAIVSGGTAISFFKDYANSTWTASGGQRIIGCVLVYEAS